MDWTGFSNASKTQTQISATEKTIERDNMSREIYIYEPSKSFTAFLTFLSQPSQSIFTLTLTVYIIHKQNRHLD